MSSAANWLIDGMNVIGSRPDGWWRDRQGAMRRLSVRLALFAASIPGEIHVVFDGNDPSGTEGSTEVDIEYAAGGPGAADRRIVRFLSEAARPENWNVVTSDGELARACSALGAPIMGAGEFRGLLEREVPDRG